MIVGTQVGNNMKTHRERRRNAQKIMSCISLTRRAHKPEQTGMPHKMHPAIPIRSPQGVCQPKMDPNGDKSGVAEPPLSSIRPIFDVECPLLFLKAMLRCILGWSGAYSTSLPWIRLPRIWI